MPDPKDTEELVEGDTSLQADLYSQWEDISQDPIQAQEIRSGDDNDVSLFEAQRRQWGLSPQRIEDERQELRPLVDVHKEIAQAQAALIHLQDMALLRASVLEQRVGGSQGPGNQLMVLTSCCHARRGDCRDGNGCPFLHDSAEHLRFLQNSTMSAVEIQCDRIVNTGPCSHLLRNRRIHPLPRNTQA